MSRYDTRTPFESLLKSCATPPQERDIPPGKDTTFHELRFRRNWQALLAGMKAQAEAEVSRRTHDQLDDAEAREVPLAVSPRSPVRRAAFARSRNAAGARSLTTGCVQRTAVGRDQAHELAVFYREPTSVPACGRRGDYRRGGGGSFWRADRAETGPGPVDQVRGCGIHWRVSQDGEILLQEGVVAS